MKVILLKEIKSLGKKSDIKEVAEGYAKNFLIKNGLAKMAKESDVKELKIKKDSLEAENKKINEALNKFANEISKQEFIFYPKTGKNNEVFNSINKGNIEGEILKKMPGKYKDRIKLKIDLEKPLKSLGEYDVNVDFNPPAGGQNIKSTIKVSLKKSFA